MKIGIVTTAFFAGLVFLIAVILINSLLIYYLAKLMKCDRDRYRTALLAATIIGIVNLGVSLAVVPFRTTLMMLEIIGVALYFIALWFTFKYVYLEERKQTIVMTIVMFLFSVLFNFILVSAATSLFNSLSFL